MEKFVKALEKNYGERLLSVVLYGSAAAGGYVAGVSDLNVLVILKDRDPNGLISLGKSAGSLMRRHRITPLVMAKEEFLSSSDVFPMEYLDLKSGYKLFYGTDVLPELEISPVHLRHQLEDRLRGMMNSLRQIGIKTEGRTRSLQKSLERWSGAIVVVFRGLCRLTDQNPCGKKPGEIVRFTAVSLDIDPKPFLDVLELRSGRTAVEPEALLVNLLNGVAALSDAVDRMDGSL